MTGFHRWFDTLQEPWRAGLFLACIAVVISLQFFGFLGLLATVVILLLGIWDRRKYLRA